MQYMDPAEFRAAGYLQELNRQFLHPLGLALEVEVLPDGTERLSNIWDCRDDPEGIHYGPGIIDPKLAERINADQDRAFDRRMARLGFMIQPAGEDTR